MQVIKSLEAELSNCSTTTGGPKRNDEDEKRIKISDNPNDQRHIFRELRGHFPKDTLEARRLIEEVANNKNNYKGTSMHGVDIYLSELPDGTQIWSQVKNGRIINAGINNVFAQFDSTIPSGIKVP